MEREYTANELPVRLPQPSDHGNSVIKYILSVGLHQTIPIGLHLISKYVVVAMDEGIYYVFSADGTFQQKLDCNASAVFATALWNDILISGGTNRCDIMVWSLKTGLEDLFVFSTIIH